MCVFGGGSIWQFDNHTVFYIIFSAKESEVALRGLVIAGM